MDRAEAFEGRGISHHALGNFAVAVADYSAAIRLGLDAPDLYYNSGMARANLSQCQLAIDD